MAIKSYEENNQKFFEVYINGFDNRGRRIQKRKRYRESKDLSQSQISKLLGMDIKNYQRIEGGRHHFSLHTLFKISQVLECKIKDLIDNT